ncbi:hypothetical protein Leryth_018261 [Lithospermum erythrorhizon]|nr:hypothetical protein Leryth_018261 [Lithospermum erythrorhizon]
MSTFTAINLDRLLEPGGRKSTTPTMSVPDPRLGRRNNNPSRRERGVNSTCTMVDRGVSVPPRLEKVNSLPIPKKGRKTSTYAATEERNNHWTRISPALYATPKSTPIPDSPSSFPPSPYIINHKRRGPRLLKSYSEDDVATSKRGLDGQKVEEDETKVQPADASSILRRVVGSASTYISTPDVLTPGWEKEDNGSFGSVLKVHVNGSPTPDNPVNGTFNLANQGNVNGHLDKDPQACETIHNSADQINTENTVSTSFQVGEVDGFLDLQDSGSLKSSTPIDVVDGFEQSTNLATAVAEFYDAWEELSSENGPQQQAVPDIEAELREIRLSLLMEIEKRKQAEETFDTMCTHWQIFRSQLSSVGLNLPADPLALTENDQLEDSAEVLSQQLYLARSVSNSIGRGIAKAEVETEMEAQLEFKNFEIARLSDRLRYYEAVNREMSQRNQEAIDNVRQLRQRRKRRQKWIWGSVAATITIGSAFLAWSHVPTGKGTLSSSHSHASEGDHASES